MHVQFMENEEHICVLKGCNKSIIFIIVRLKNFTSYVEWYGKNVKLRDLVNLITIAGDRRKESKDVKEITEAESNMNDMNGNVEEQVAADVAGADFSPPPRI